MHTAVNAWTSTTVRVRHFIFDFGKCGHRFACGGTTKQGIRRSEYFVCTWYIDSSFEFCVGYLWCVQKLGGMTADQHVIICAVHAFATLLAARKLIPMCTHHNTYRYSTK